MGSLAGSKLGRYEVLRELTHGGTADLWVARVGGPEGFERHVVIKRMRVDRGRDPAAVAAFLARATAAASLNHASIARVVDVGEDQGAPYLVMEYVHGEDLRRVLGVMARTYARVPLPVAVAITSAAATALHHAHEQLARDSASVHGDVAPANILVGYDGHVKLLDFGLPAAFAPAADGDADGRALRDKVAYRSPEQCGSGPVDRRSDVFALGVVLYELVTSRRLFKGETVAATIDLVARGVIPLPSTSRKELPPALEAVMMRALDRDPAKRFQTMAEVHAALDAVTASLGWSTSATAVAAFLASTCGTRPEPWTAPDEPVRSVEPVDFDGARRGVATLTFGTASPKIPSVVAKDRAASSPAAKLPAPSRTKPLTVRPVLDVARPASPPPPMPPATLVPHVAEPRPTLRGHVSVDEVTQTVADEDLLEAPSPSLVPPATAAVVVAPAPIAAPRVTAPRVAAPIVAAPIVAAPLVAARAVHEPALVAAAVPIDESVTSVGAVSADEPPLGEPLAAELESPPSVPRVAWVPPYDDGDETAFVSVNRSPRWLLPVVIAGAVGLVVLVFAIALGGKSPVSEPIASGHAGLRMGRDAPEPTPPVEHDAGPALVAIEQASDASDALDASAPVPVDAQSTVEALAVTPPDAATPEPRISDAAPPDAGVRTPVVRPPGAGAPNVRTPKVRTPKVRDHAVHAVVAQGPRRPQTPKQRPPITKPPRHPTKRLPPPKWNPHQLFPSKK